MNGNYIRT